jgi:hypothetical protein
MDDNNNTVTQGGSRRGRTVGAATGLLAAGLVAGGILAGTLGASAATTDTTATPSATATSGSASGSGSNGTTPVQPPANVKSPTPVRSDEKAVSAGLAAQLKAKAEAAVSGGTVYRVETDAGDAAYEAHMTKSDGTQVTVKFDKTLTVTSIEDGLGKGDPAPAGGPMGAPQGGSQSGQPSGQASSTA